METVLYAILERPTYSQAADLLRLWSCFDLKKDLPLLALCESETLVSSSRKQYCTFQSLSDREAFLNAATQLRAVVSVTKGSSLRFSKKLKSKDFKFIEEAFRPTDFMLARAGALIANAFPPISLALVEDVRRSLLLPHAKQLVAKLVQRLQMGATSRDIQNLIDCQPFQRLIISIQIPFVSLWPIRERFNGFDQINVSIQELKALNCIGTLEIQLLSYFQTFSLLVRSSSREDVSKVSPTEQEICTALSEQPVDVAKLFAARDQNNLFDQQFSAFERISLSLFELYFDKCPLDSCLQLITRSNLPIAAANKLLATAHILKGTSPHKFVIAYHLLAKHDVITSCYCHVQYVIHGGDPTNISTVSTDLGQLVRSLLEELGPDHPFISTTIGPWAARYGGTSAIETLLQGSALSHRDIKRISEKLQLQIDQFSLIHNESSFKWATNPLFVAGVITSLCAGIAMIVTLRHVK